MRYFRELKQLSDRVRRVMLTFLCTLRCEIRSFFGPNRAGISGFQRCEMIQSQMVCLTFQLSQECSCSF